MAGDSKLRTGRSEILIIRDGRFEGTFKKRNKLSQTVTEEH